VGWGHNSGLVFGLIQENQNPHPCRKERGKDGPPGTRSARKNLVKGVWRAKMRQLIEQMEKINP